MDEVFKDRLKEMQTLKTVRTVDIALGSDNAFKIFIEQCSVIPLATT